MVNQADALEMSTPVGSPGEKDMTSSTTEYNHLNRVGDGHGRQSRLVPWACQHLICQEMCRKGQPVHIVPLPVNLRQQLIAARFELGDLHIRNKLAGKILVEDMLLDLTAHYLTQAEISLGCAGSRCDVRFSCLSRAVSLSSVSGMLGHDSPDIFI